MWQYNNFDELYHYGVLGMKWGHKKRYKATLADAKLAYKKRNSSIQKRYDIGMADIEKNYKRGQMLSDKDQKRELDLDDMARRDWAKSKAIYKDAKRKAKYDYKTNVAKTKDAYKNNYKQLKSESDALDKLVFNSATRARAAKYMTQNNMTMSEAKKRARKDAVKNTATTLAVIGGLSLVQLAKEKLNG